MLESLLFKLGKSLAPEHPTKPLPPSLRYPNVDPQNSESFRKGHWRRDEEKYFTEQGITDFLRREPIAGYGREMLRSPDDGTLRQDVEPEFNALTNSSNYGSYSPSENKIRVAQTIKSPDGNSYQITPQHGAQVIEHELGHVGSQYLDPRAVYNGQEENRQRMTDFTMNSGGERSNAEAFLAAAGFDPQDLRRVEEGRKTKNPALHSILAQNRKLVIEANRRLAALKAASATQ